MKNIYVAFILLSVLTLAGCNKQTSAVRNESNNLDASTVLGVDSKKADNYPVSSIDQIAERLEVYYFHKTARCSSCKTIGQYVGETMEQKYEKQIEDGLIDFRVLNIDLPENKEIAKKYQASGSSLFMNRIIDGADNIEQDTGVWRYLNDETKFKNYLENKINSSLGLY